jgi:hypothetical protein
MNKVLKKMISDSTTKTEEFCNILFDLYIAPFLDENNLLFDYGMGTTVFKYRDSMEKCSTIRDDLKYYNLNNELEKIFTQSCFEYNDKLSAMYNVISGIKDSSKIKKYLYFLFI